MVYRISGDKLDIKRLRRMKKLLRLIGIIQTVIGVVLIQSNYGEKFESWWAGTMILINGIVGIVCGKSEISSRLVNSHKVLSVLSCTCSVCLAAFAIKDLDDIINNLPVVEMLKPFLLVAILSIASFGLSIASFVICGKTTLAAGLAFWCGGQCKTVPIGVTQKDETEETILLLTSNPDSGKPAADEFQTSEFTELEQLTPTAASDTHTADSKSSQASVKTAAKPGIEMVSSSAKAGEISKTSSPAQPTDHQEALVTKEDHFDYPEQKESLGRTSGKPEIEKTQPSLNITNQSSQSEHRKSSEEKSETEIEPQRPEAKEYDSQKEPDSKSRFKKLGSSIERYLSTKKTQYSPSDAKDESNPEKQIVPSTATNSEDIENQSFAEDKKVGSDSLVTDQNKTPAEEESTKKPSTKKLRS